MGLLTKLVALLSSDRVTYTYVNNIVDDLYNALGTTINGRGSLTWENLSATAEIVATQVSGTAAVLGGGVTQVFINLLSLAWGSWINVGTGTADALLGGNIHTNFTSVGNINGGEDALMSYTLPANSLNTTGRGLRITAFGTATNNANAKNLRFYWGGVLIYNTAFLASSNTHWKVEILVFRTALNTQIYVITATGDNMQETTYDKGVVSGASATETGTIVIAFTGEATTTNDIIQYGMIIEAT